MPHAKTDAEESLGQTDKTDAERHSARLLFYSPRATGPSPM